MSKIGWRIFHCLCCGAYWKEVSVDYRSDEPSKCIRKECPNHFGNTIKAVNGYHDHTLEIVDGMINAWHTKVEISEETFKNINNGFIDMSLLDIEQRFGPYRKPTEKTIPKYQEVQRLSLELAKYIDKNCPPSKEKEDALLLLQQAKMMANASIAIYTAE